MCGGKWCNVQVYLCLDYFWGHHPLLVLHVTQFVLLNQDISSVLITIVWCYLCFSLLSTYQHIVYDIWFLIFRKKIFPKEITISISSVNSLVFFSFHCINVFKLGLSILGNIHFRLGIRGMTSNDSTTEDTITSFDSSMLILLIFGDIILHSSLAQTSSLTLSFPRTWML